jgi:hypothetical protein
MNSLGGFIRKPCECASRCSLRTTGKLSGYEEGTFFGRIGGGFGLLDLFLITMIGSGAMF